MGDVCEIVGINIRKKRHAAGLSQEELAFRARIDRAYLSQIENGKKNITLLLLADLAAALGVDPVLLLQREKR